MAPTGKERAATTSTAANPTGGPTSSISTTSTRVWMNRCVHHWAYLSSSPSWMDWWVGNWLVGWLMCSVLDPTTASLAWLASKHSIQLLLCLFDFCRVLINPFTAMLAAPSLGKRPMKVPDLKPLRIFSSVVWAHERTSIQMHSIERRFVTGPSDTQYWTQICHRTIRYTVCGCVCEHFF